MNELRYTLLPEGSSDKALIPILTWLLRHIGIEQAIQQNFAEVWRLRDTPRGMAEKIVKSLELYPCDLLFVHRDADRELREARVTEIQIAVEEARRVSAVPPVACVVPVRMQETWLLFDEEAIRRASGSPNGRDRLRLPELRSLERLADPKAELNNLIRTASGLTGRHLKRLKVSKAATQISGFIQDFSPLLALPAFRALETELRLVAEQNRWNT